MTPLGTSIPNSNQLDLWFQRMYFVEKWELPQKYNYANFTTIWLNLTDVTLTNRHNKFQINRTCSFREEVYLTKNGKNWPKITIMQISPQFEKIWLMSPQQTSIRSFKSIGLAVSEKKCFWPKMGKIAPKTQICRFSSQFDQIWLMSPQPTSIPSFKSVWHAFWRRSWKWKSWRTTDTGWRPP